MTTDPWGLTPRHWEVLDALVEHSEAKVMARHLGLGIGTVKTHLHEIYKRMGVPGQVRAAVVWDRWRRSV